MKSPGVPLFPGSSNLKTFQENHRRLIDETISQDKCRREPAWTESVATQIALERLPAPRHAAGHNFSGKTGGEARQIRTRTNEL
jgi:hypothetical protein